MNWILSTEFLGKHFIQMETGQGKTAICLTIAALISKAEGISIIVNNSQDLLFRDFKTAARHAQALNIKVHFADNQTGAGIDTAQLIFSSPEQLVNVIQELKKVPERRVVLIVDEFDSLLFEVSARNQDVNRAIQGLPNVYGLSGSQLQVHHKEFISTQFNGQCVDFTVNLFNRQPAIQHDVNVYQLLKDYVNEIAKLCQSRSKDVPIVCIVDECHERISAALKRSAIPVLNLCVAEMSAVESSLRIFNQKQSNAYPVALINENQGRGLDFKSSTDIENAGGVFVIIGILPKTILQYKQFIGRTGRIGNKGQYSVILHDKESKGFVGSLYLERKLEELRNLDLLQFQRMPRIQAEISGQLREQTLNNSQDLIKINSHLHNEEEKQFDEKKINEDMASENEATESECSLPEVKPSLSLQKNIAQVGLINPTTESVKAPRKMSQERDASFKLRQARKLSSPLSFKNEVDRGYFEGYGRLEIHNEMLNDRVRMRKYKDAIDATCKDKTVIDVGAGTAFLSCQAARAGAVKVYALENSDIVHHALKVVKDNKLSHIVKVIQGEASNFEMPEGRADVVVSEWMGYMLIYERMLPSVLQVRNNCLKEDGTMIPSSASIWIAAMSKPPQSDEIDLRSIKKASYKKAQVMECKPMWVCSNLAKVLSIDLQKEEFEANSFTSNFTLAISRESRMTGFVIWFEADLCPGVTLSTSPMEELTHWMQTVLSLRDDRQCIEGETIQGTISVSPQPRNHRALKIDLTVLFEVDSKKVSEQYKLEVD